MPSLGGDQYKWYCEIPPLAEPGNYPGGVKTKPPFEMGVDDFDISNDTGGMTVLQEVFKRYEKKYLLTEDGFRRLMLAVGGSFSRINTNSIRSAISILTLRTAG